MRNFIDRQLAVQAKELGRQFRALCITGPRQSGKTTLARMAFPRKPYVTLEDPRVQALAAEDPAAFLDYYKTGAILDEVQRVPDLFRYLQVVLDRKQTRGQFVLTGSSNFLLQQQISQSLAGRTGFLELLPLSYAELNQANIPVRDVNQLIFKGGYPELWQHPIEVERWMSAYLRTYVQRDVRLIRNISNLGTFSRFVQLIATYAGQLINRESIGMMIGVDNKTVASWISLLESSYVVFLLYPHFNNLNKRIIKAPKLYFYDTGLLCFLLGITSPSALVRSSRYGALFENWVISEIRKNRYNRNQSEGMYFFRDSAGNEVDLLLEKEDQTLAVEIKSTKKFKPDLLSGLRYWQKYNRVNQGLLICNDGAMTVDDHTHVLNWKDVESL